MFGVGLNLQSWYLGMILPQDEVLCCIRICEIGSCHVPVDSSIQLLVHQMAHATFSTQRGGSS
jgi:hypothetical protein